MGIAVVTADHPIDLASGRSVAPGEAIEVSFTDPHIMGLLADGHLERKNDMSLPSGAEVKELTRAVSHSSVNVTGVTVVDVPGLVVSPSCSGKPIELEIGGFAQVSLNGAAAGTRVSLYLYVEDETGFSYWLSTVQMYLGNTDPGIMPVRSTKTIWNVTPGRHTWKLRARMGSANGIGVLFAGNTGPGDPIFDWMLAVKEIG